MAVLFDETGLGEGADGLSVTGFGGDVGLGSYDVVGDWWQRMVASMDGFDGWRRW